VLAIPRTVIPSFVPPPVLFLFATEVVVQVPQVFSHLPQSFSQLGALRSLLALLACHERSTSPNCAPTVSVSMSETFATRSRVKARYQAHHTPTSMRR
jgi:hypothetical protein